MTFHDAYHYADTIFAERFEGILKTQNHNWTQDEIRRANNTQKVYLNYIRTTHARKLEMSQLLKKPLQHMKSLHDKNVSTSNPKYHLFSGHDDQVSAILTQILPEYNYTYIPYVSTIYFEFHEP